MRPFDMNQMDSEMDERADDDDLETDEVDEAQYQEKDDFETTDKKYHQVNSYGSTPDAVDSSPEVVALTEHALLAL